MPLIPVGYPSLVEAVGVMVTWLGSGALSIANEKVGERQIPQGSLI